MQNGIQMLKNGPNNPNNSDEVFIEFLRELEHETSSESELIHCFFS